MTVDLIFQSRLLEVTAELQAALSMPPVISERGDLTAELLAHLRAAISDYQAALA